MLSKEARKSATDVMVPVSAAHASFAPISTVTIAGWWAAAARAWSGRSATCAPDRATFQLLAAPSRVLTLSTCCRPPVAHDTSGQSDTGLQASKPRVMESPSAATLLGWVFHGRAGAASRGVPPEGAADPDCELCAGGVPRPLCGAPPPNPHPPSRTAVTVSARACRDSIRMRFFPPTSG